MLSSQEIQGHIDNMREQYTNSSAGKRQGHATHELDSGNKIEYSIYEQGNQTVAEWQHMNSSGVILDLYRRFFSYYHEALNYLNGDQFNKPIRTFQG